MASFPGQPLTSRVIVEITQRIRTLNVDSVTRPRETSPPVATATNGTRLKNQPKLDPKLPFGTNYCRCSACGEYFGGVRAFDDHRVGPADDRACLDACGMAAVGLTLNARGYWKRQCTAMRGAA